MTRRRILTVLSVVILLVAGWSVFFAFNPFVYPTESNYEQVRVGMSVDEVSAVLGSKTIWIIADFVDARPVGWEAMEGTIWVKFDKDGAGDKIYQKKPLITIWRNRVFEKFGIPAHVFEY